jgi:hypothetical protein
VFPVVFWDLFGEQGHPIRTTIAEMGPLLLSRLLQLNEVQEGRAQHPVPLLRREQAAAARSEGSARHAGRVRLQQGASDRS